MLRWARRGGEGLQGGQKNGLDLCRIHIFINMNDRSEGQRESYRLWYLRQRVKKLGK